MNQLAESGSIGDGGLRQTDTLSQSLASNALGTLGLHWPEYLMEAGELGLYMFFACAFATLLQHTASPVRHFISSSLARRALLWVSDRKHGYWDRYDTMGEAVWRSLQPGHNFHLL
jgi:hypothetical protein